MRDAKENCEKKITARNPGGEERALLAPRISRGHFFLAVLFRVTHDGLSERGTACSPEHRGPWDLSRRVSGVLQFVIPSFFNDGILVLIGVVCVNLLFFQKTTLANRCGLTQRIEQSSLIKEAYYYSLDSQRGTFEQLQNSRKSRTLWQQTSKA